MLGMLHLSVAGGDLTCAKHGVAASTPSRHAHVAEHQHRHSQPVHAHADESDQCDTPVTVHCCAAMMSCAPTVLPSVVATAEPTLFDSEKPTARADAPLSYSMAPETPPPRA